MFTTTQARGILQGIVRNKFLGLSTTEPNIDGGNVTEPIKYENGQKVDNGYTRVFLGDENSFDFEPSNGISNTIYNKDEYHFNEPKGEASWGQIQFFVIFDHETSGKPIYFGRLENSIEPQYGSIPVIRAGSLRITMQ